MSTPSARNAGRPEYRIRVKPMVPWPGSHTGGNHGIEGVHYTGKMPSPRQVVLIIGEPVKPDKKWDCGTDIVWPVLEIEGAPCVELHADYYVCRHQIQIGD